MLAIRMQRTGRRGHAMFRVIVQDSRRTPTSGKIVARLGSYDPHAKTLTLDKEKAGFYLEHGAQPSPRVVVLLQKEGVKLPDWVQKSTKKESSVRNPDKRRSTRPEEPAEEVTAEAEAPATEEKPAEAPEAEAQDEAPEEQPAETETQPEQSETDSEASESQPEDTDEKPAE